jgi:polyisoprenoid-binding protein YceI
MSKAVWAMPALMLGLALTPAMVSTGGAQSAPPAKLPEGVIAAERDIKLATAGNYNLDPMHTAVIARVSHLGYSWSVFRFDRTQGTLAWDPAAVAKSKLSVSVQTNSVATNVEGFAAQIAGDDFLKSAAFPQATFASTAFRQKDATHGQVDGQFTLMGKSVPLTFDVALVGAGKGFMGKPRIGVQARAVIKPQDFGLPPLMTDPIELVIDTEFEKAP